jgi:hypothetical protein
LTTCHDRLPEAVSVEFQYPQPMRCARPWWCSPPARFAVLIRDPTSDRQDVCPEGLPERVEADVADSLSPALMGRSILSPCSTWTIFSSVIGMLRERRAS